MESTLLSLAHGFSVALAPANAWYAFLGCLVGTLVGVLPGIGPLAGISILLPVTFGLNATQAIIMLAGIYYGSQYGGSTTSILMRIPGEASLVMTPSTATPWQKAAPVRPLHRGGWLMDRRGLWRAGARASPLPPSRSASDLRNAALLVLG